MWKEFSTIEPVQRYVKNVISRIKNVLCTLPMMNVPIHNDCLFFGLFNKVIGSNRNIIKEGKSMRLIFEPTMMSRRADERNNIYLRLFQIGLNSYDHSFSSFKSSFKCLFHVVSIDIDEHFGFGETFTPHAFDEIKVSFAMQQFNLILS